MFEGLKVLLSTGGRRGATEGCVAHLYVGYLWEGGAYGSVFRP